VFFSTGLGSPKPEEHPLSAVRDCLFNIPIATLHIWSPSSPPTWRSDMQWWQWADNMARAPRRFQWRKVFVLVFESCMGSVSGGTIVLVFLSLSDQMRGSALITPRALSLRSLPVHHSPILPFDAVQSWDTVSVAKYSLLEVFRFPLRSERTASTVLDGWVSI
jgi:hypothetical protein